MDHKFRLPSPCFKKVNKSEIPVNNLPHFSSPHGMLLARNKQPPPMYGPRGATIPPKYINEYTKPQMNQKLEKVWCESCDRNFNSVEIFEKHRKQHRKCGIEDCNFIGCPEIVEKHIEQQHITGLYDKIKKLSTPEEIEEWRQERRRKYPTKENIEKRQQAQRAKFQRGEKIEAPKNRFAKRQDQTFQKPTINRNVSWNETKSNKQNNNRWRKKNPISNRKDSKENNLEEKTVLRVVDKNEENVSECIDNSSIPMFRGTSFLEDYSRPKSREKSTDNPIFNLVGMYGSDDASSTEEEEEIVCKPISKASINDKSAENITESSYLVLHKEDNKLESTNLEAPSLDKTESQEKIQTLEQSKDVCENLLIKANETLNNSDSDDAPEEIPIEKSTPSFPNEKINEDKPENEMSLQKTDTSTAGKKGKRKFQQQSSSKATKKLKTTLLNYSKLRTPRQNTMLEKLLEPDIRHERNVLLQCVRFVVENKFFGIGSKS